MAIKQTGIYGFVFPNRKEYWGQSINVDKRVRTHFSRSSKKDNIKYIVDNAIRKYGKENIQIYIFYCQEEYLDYAETEMIKRRNSICPSGYNLDSGGKVNRHPSIETKNKLSFAKKGKPSKRGWHHTTETKAKLSSLLMDLYTLIPKYYLLRLEKN
jgi:group I intron endonuclease